MESDRFSMHTLLDDTFSGWWVLLQSMKTWILERCYLYCSKSNAVTHHMTCHLPCVDEV
jgi:hypothetical protein